MMPSPAVKLAPASSPREEIAALEPTPRILALRMRMLAEPRYLSLEQALVITEVYKANEGASVPRKRALALAETMRRLARAGAPDATVVGHIERGSGVRLPHLGLAYEGYAA